MNNLVQCLCDYLGIGTLVLVEVNDNTISLQVIFDYPDEVVTLKDLRPALKPLGVKDLWKDKMGTNVTYTFRLTPDPSESEKTTLKAEIERLFPLDPLSGY